MNYYKRHIGDYAAKAGHLTPLEHGVYTLLLDAYYNREEGPTRSEAIRWARARSKDEVAAVDAVLAEFFDEQDGRYVQERVEEELASFRECQDTNRRIAVEREARKRARSVHEACSKREPSHKPLAISHKPEDQKQGRASAPELPGWLPVDAWRDWHTFRNARKGWTTKARELSLRTLAELHEAGHDPRKVIDQSIERGWTGLFPIRESARGSPRPSVAQQFADKTYTGTPDDELPAFLQPAAH